MKITLNLWSTDTKVGQTVTAFLTEAEHKKAIEDEIRNLHEQDEDAVTMADEMAGLDMESDRWGALYCEWTEAESCNQNYFAHDTQELDLADLPLVQEMIGLLEQLSHTTTDDNEDCCLGQAAARLLSKLEP